MSTTDRLRIVDTGVRPGKQRVVAQLRGARFGKRLHLVLGSEMQASGRAGFDAGRLKPCADAIRAERTFVHLLRHRIEAGNIERTSRNTILAADAVLLLKIDDAVGVLNN